MQQTTEQLLEPPLYFASDHIFDLHFHPHQDVLTLALITGDIKLLSYHSEDVKEIASFNHHLESARISQFSPNGQHLLTASKDKSWALLDQKGKLIYHKQNAYKYINKFTYLPIRTAINAAKFLNDQIVVLGDDDGKIKIWDLRNAECVYQVQENDESITDFELGASSNFLLSTSLDGHLCVFDLRVKNKLFARSDCMEEDLTAISLVKNGQFAAVSTSEGNILLFKWDFWGDFKDRIIGHPNSIDSLIKVDEQTLISGGEDGLIRGVSVFPNGIVNILGQHEEDQQFPISKIARDRSGFIGASISHDNSVKFYDWMDFINKRKGTPFQQAPENFAEIPRQKKEQIEDSEDDSDIEEEEDDEEKEGKNKKNMKRVRNLKESKRQMKQEKIKKFFDKL